MVILKNQSDIKKEYKLLIASLKEGLINPNADIKLGFGLIGSDKSRLLRIKQELKNFKEDIKFYNKFGFPEVEN